MDHYLPAVCRSLGFIEENLTTSISLERIARQAGFSLWHFQRVFAAYVGEPPGSYLRRRRITSAARDLRDTRRAIIDIAFDYQFESHAAFTRAFAAVLRRTPSEFRRTRRLPRFQARPQLTAADLQHLSRNVTMKPQIIKSPALTLLGLEARFIGPMSPDANNHQVIPPLFAEFFRRREELPAALDGFTYGACRCLPAVQRTREDELVYLVGASVAKTTQVPTGMKVWQVPALTYAAFQHRGQITKIGETLNYIYGTWLPRSDYTHADGPSLERYDARFGDGDDKSEIDILIPVQPRR